MNGGGSAYLLEHQAPSVSQRRKVIWARKSIDLALLAKLRQIEKLTLDDIAKRMGVCRSSVDRGMRLIRAKERG